MPQESPVLLNFLGKRFEPTECLSNETRRRIIRHPGIVTLLFLGKRGLTNAGYEDFTFFTVKTPEE